MKNARLFIAKCMMEVREGGLLAKHAENELSRFLPFTSPGQTIKRKECKYVDAPRGTAEAIRPGGGYLRTDRGALVRETPKPHANRAEQKQLRRERQVELGWKEAR